MEDSLKNIWMGSPLGISCYSIQADTFTNILGPDTAGMDHSIVPFSSSSSTVYCLESGFRIVQIDIHSFKKKLLLSLADKERNLVVHSDQIVFDSLTNSLWLPEFSSPDNPSGGLMQILMAHGEVKHYGWTCFRNILKHDHVFEAMRLDRKRNLIWINSASVCWNFPFSTNSLPWWMLSGI